jgi:hypothetical protein
MSHGPCQADRLARPTRPIPVCKLRPDNVAATFRGPQEAERSLIASHPMKPLKLFVYVTRQITARLSHKAPLSRVQITGSSPTADIITPPPRLMRSDLIFIFKRVRAQSHKYDAFDTFGRRKFIAQNPDGDDEIFSAAQDRSGWRKGVMRSVGNCGRPSIRRRYQRYACPR